MIAPTLVAGCLPSDTFSGQRSIEYNFRTTDHDWEPGFANFHPDQEESLDLVAGHEPLPGSLNDPGSGLFIAGTNHPDDLFMFWKGRYGELQEGRRYRVEFFVEFVTEAPSGCAGIGGAPGESVYLKAGATAQEPTPLVEGEGEEAYVVMNIDKGNQAVEGTDARILGHIGNSASECTDLVWEFKILEGHEPFEVVADGQGAVWLFVGTDSGFEGRTRLYYTRFRATFHPLQGTGPG